MFIDQRTIVGAMAILFEHSSLDCKETSMTFHFLWEKILKMNYPLTPIWRRMKPRLEWKTYFNNIFGENTKTWKLQSMWQNNLKLSTFRHFNFPKHNIHFGFCFKYSFFNIIKGWKAYIIFLWFEFEVKLLDGMMKSYE